MGKSYSEGSVVQAFKSGLDCSQVVAMAWAEELGYSEEETARMMAAFGGGMFRGDTCGAVTGALFVLGLAEGHCQPGDTEKKQALLKKVGEFQKQFTQRQGSTLCRELISYDFSQEGELEKALASGELFVRCPKNVLAALDILEEMLG